MTTLSNDFHAVFASLRDSAINGQRRRVLRNRAGLAFLLDKRELTFVCFATDSPYRAVVGFRNSLKAVTERELEDSESASG